MTDKEKNYYFFLITEVTSETMSLCLLLLGDWCVNHYQIQAQYSSSVRHDVFKEQSIANEYLLPVQKGELHFRRRCPSGLISAVVPRHTGITRAVIIILDHNADTLLNSTM